MPDIPNMSLKVASFQPATFMPSQYQYQGEDLSILERSLQQREARMAQAAESQSAVDVALGKIETQLHRDPTTDAWFNQYKQNIKDQIQTQVDAGNFGSAFRTATRLAGNVAQDTPVLGRIRANEDFKKEMETQQARRDKGEISQNTYDWWLSNNPYSYSDITDNNGNIIGGSTWAPENRPVADINWAGQAMAAFKMITPDKGTKGRESKKGTTNADGTGTQTGSSSTQSYERVSAQDIRDNIERMLSATSDGYRQAEQAYDVAVFEWNRMKEQYNSMSDDDPNKVTLGEKIAQRNQLMMCNGSPISYKEYYARMITDDLYSQGLAYDWRTDNKGSTSTTDNELSGRGTDAGLTGGLGNYIPGQNLLWNGANVRLGMNYNLNVLNGSSYGIVNRFN